MKNKVAKILAVALTVSMLAGCGSGASGGGEQSGTVGAQTEENVEQQEAAGETAASSGEKVVTLANNGAWEALHPFSSNRDTHVAFLYPLYDSWVTVCPDGTLKPRLFTSWDFSEDGQTVICKMDERATWSDGEPITAHDVEWTYKTWASDLGLAVSKTTSVFAGTDDNGDLVEGEEFGVKALDDYTVSLDFKEKSTIYANMCSLGYTFVLPEHVLKDVPLESLPTDGFWEKPVTSGPFTLDNIISGERMEYVARDDYYLGRPQMDRLVIRVIPGNNILSSMLAGEVDGTVYGSLMAYSDYELAKQEESLETYEQSGFGHKHLLLNNKKLDVNMRLAIDHAVNKQSIIDGVLNGYGRLSDGPFLPESPYYNDAVEMNPYDPEIAKEYLEKSGYDVSQPLTLIFSSADDLGQRIAVLVQQDLAAIGLTMNIETYDAATISSKLFDGEFDLGLMGSASDPVEEDGQKFYFWVDGWNQITDESWLELFAEGFAGTEVEERKPAYDKLQERLVDEAPMIFLYHPDILFVNSKKISGMPYENFSKKGWQYETWTVE